MGNIAHALDSLLGVDFASLLTTGAKERLTGRREDAPNAIESNSQRRYALRSRYAKTRTTTSANRRPHCSHHLLGSMNKHELYHGSCWDEALPARLDVVVRNWSMAVAKREPWGSMLLDDVTGELRAVAAALINAACDNGDVRRSRIVRAASAHGQFRRAQRFPKRLLTAELAALREAIRTDLQSGYWSETLVEQAVDGLVADLRLARRRAERAFRRKPDAAAPIPEVQHHA